MNKLDRKDFTIAVKTGSDANKSKFAKEAVKGEAYYATDSENLYFAQSTAGLSDAFLMKLEPSALSYGNNYSLDFDGVDDYVDVGNDSALSISGALSVSAWIYADSLAGYPMFLSKRASVSGHAYQFYSTGNKLNYNNGTIVQSTGTISIGSWTHVAVTFNGAGAVVFYINGSSAGTATAASSNPTNSGSVTIGRAYNGNYFNGKIDEVSLFNSALSASDISSIYNNGTANYIGSFNPVGWWRMGDNDNGTGTTITDQGSGGNDATLTNGPTFSTDVP